MDDIQVAKLGAFESALHAHFANTQGTLMGDVAKSGNWNDDIEATFKKGIEEFKATGTW